MDAAAGPLSLRASSSALACGPTPETAAIGRACARKATPTPARAATHLAPKHKRAPKNTRTSVRSIDARLPRRRTRTPPRPAPSPQVIALCAAPFLLQHPKVGELFPADAIARAKQLLGAFAGGIGAYQDSRGNMMVRQEVADFIKARDGYPADANVRPGGAAWAPGRGLPGRVLRWARARPRLNLSAGLSSTGKRKGGRMAARARHRPRFGASSSAPPLTRRRPPPGRLSPPPRTSS